MNINHSLRIGLFILGFGLASVACQRNPESVQASREVGPPVGTNPNINAPAITPSDQNKDMLLSQADGQFMKHAEDSDIKERNLARVVMARSSNKDVKDYAKMIADDHTKDLHNAVDLMENKGIHQPKDMVEIKHESEARLSGLSSPALDREYINMMIKDHQKDIAQYNQEQSSGEDPAVRDYAAHALETLQKHLQKAQDLQNKLGNGK